VQIDFASLVGVKLVQASEHTLAQLPNAPPVPATTPTSVASERSPSSVLAMGDGNSDSVRLEKHNMVDAARDPVKALELNAATVRPKDVNEVGNREGPIEACVKPEASKEIKQGMGGEEKLAQEGQGKQEMTASGACGPETLLGGGKGKGLEHEGQDGELYKDRKMGSTASTIGMIEDGNGVQAKVEEKKVPAQSDVGESGREELVHTENGHIRTDAGFVGTAAAVRMDLGPSKVSNSKTLDPKTPPAWQQWENVANLLSRRRAEIAQQAAAKKQEEVDKLRKAAQEEGAEGNEGKVKDEGDRGASVGVGHVAEEERSRRETASGTGHEEGAERAGGERASLERKPDEKVERSAPGGLDGSGGKGDIRTGADWATRADAPESIKMPVESVKNSGPSLEKAVSVLPNSPSLQEANEGKRNGGHSATELGLSPALQTAKPLSLTASNAGADQTMDPSTSAGRLLMVPKERSRGGLPEARNSPGLCSEKTRPGTEMASGVGVRGAVKPRAPRLGALGPTLAYLRAQQNQLG
jgi:hypothetical protein